MTTEFEIRSIVATAAIQAGNANRAQAAECRERGDHSDWAIFMSASAANIALANALTADFGEAPKQAADMDRADGLGGDPA